MTSNPVRRREKADSIVKAGWALLVVAILCTLFVPYEAVEWEYYWDSSGYSYDTYGSELFWPGIIVIVLFWLLALIVLPAGYIARGRAKRDCDMYGAMRQPAYREGPGTFNAYRDEPRYGNGGFAPSNTWDEPPLPSPPVAGRSCPSCRGPVEGGWIACPTCGTSLQRMCPHCGVTIEPGFSFCPLCASPVRK